MEVKQMQPGIWRVSDGPKWWTAKQRMNYGLPYWFITNSRGAVVVSSGPTGRRIIAAIRHTLEAPNDELAKRRQAPERR